MFTDVSLRYTIVEQSRWELDQQRRQGGAAISHPGEDRGRQNRTAQTPDVDPRLYAVRFVTPECRERLAAAPPKRIVVVCNGQATGDSACRLAADLAAVTGASVRAVAVLQPAQIAQMTTVSVDDPVETLLTGVTQQLYRATPTPGLWCLTLLVGALVDQLAQACRGNMADLLILPEAECGEAAVATIGTQAIVMVFCVAASDKVMGSLVGGPSTARASTQDVMVECW